MYRGMIEEKRTCKGGTDEESIYNGYTEARKRANERYIESNRITDVRIRLPEEQKEELKKAAAAAGESINLYVTRAIADRIQKEGEEDI